MQNGEQTLANKETPLKAMRQKALNNLILFHNALVRPLKYPEGITIDNVCYGEIVKLPTEKTTSRLEDSEFWKRLVKDKEDTGFNIGDRVLYDSKINIVICGKSYHLVSYFLGKLNNEQNNN